MGTSRATSTTSPGMAPTAPPSLKSARLDADAAAYANRLAEDWRATGLAAGLDELPGGAGYVLTARSPSRTLRCECRRWRHRGIPLARGRVWTIAVAVGRADAEPARPAGFAAGDAPEAAGRAGPGRGGGRGRPRPGPP